MSGDSAPGHLIRRRSTPLPREIETTTYDLAIVGAGINGCGIARDAATRGLRVLLVDMGDIGSQTTAWSTRLIHGGLRYLEHFELSLVRESLRERATLLSTAPHLVEPLRFMLPIYDGHRRGPLTIRAGMLAYDVLSPRKRLPRHRMLSRAEAIAHEPGLDARGLRGAALYYDAQVTFPERLALENALAAAQGGCVVVTYLRVTSIDARPERVVSLRMRDILDDVPIIATARVVVNATGPWVDDLTSGFTEQRLVGGTKGSHIVVPPFEGAPRCAVYAEAAGDRRPFFVIPWNDLYLIGTTDSRYDGDPAQAMATGRDARYLIDQTNAIFPEARLDRSAVLFAYAGVRPLPRNERETESAITRRHSIVRHDPPFDMALSVVGGKLTTYRALAESVTDRVFEILQRVDPGTSTAEIPLPGGEPISSGAKDGEVAAIVSREVTDRLKRVYGSRWTDVVEFAKSRGDTGTLETTAVLRAEPAFAIKHEFAQTLEDVMMRRTMAGLTARQGIEIAEEARLTLEEYGAWRAERASVDHERFGAYLRRFAVVQEEEAGPAL